MLAVAAWACGDRKFPKSLTAPPPGIVGTTDNITKVARSVQVRAKSLTTPIGVTESVILIEREAVAGPDYDPTDPATIMRSKRNEQLAGC